MTTPANGTVQEPRPQTHDNTPLTDDDPPGARHTLTRAQDAADQYAAESLSAATRRAYRHDWSCFLSWCESVRLAALPASEQTLCAFLGAQGELGLSVSTITRRMAAIRAAHEAFDQPCAHQAPAVRQVMRGLRRNRKGRAVSKKAALRDKDLARWIDGIDTATLTGQRDKALLLIGFAAALRRSELVGIDVAHLAFSNQGVLITIPYSKTDQTGTNAEIAVPALPASPYCPVTALQTWLSASGITDGAVFRRMRRGGHLGAQRLSGGAVAKLVKHYATTAGEADVSAFSAHSLRRGFITTAAKNREDLFAIADQSRHRSIETVREYVEAEERFDDHPGLRMFDKHS